MNLHSRSIILVKARAILQLVEKIRLESSFLLPFFFPHKELYMIAGICSLLFFFFLMNKNFIHKTKTELQIGYKSLILNDNLKTGRAETSIKDPKTLFANTYLCYLVFVLSAIWVYIYRQCKLSFLVDSSMNSLVNEA